LKSLSQGYQEKKGKTKKCNINTLNIAYYAKIVQNYREDWEEIYAAHSKLSFAFGVPLGFLTVFHKEPVKSIIKTQLLDELAFKETIISEEYFEEEKVSLIKEATIQEDTLRSTGISTKDEEDTIQQNPLFPEINKLLCVFLSANSSLKWILQHYRYLIY